MSLLSRSIYTQMIAIHLWYANIRTRCHIAENNYFILRTKVINFWEKKVYWKRSRSAVQFSTCRHCPLRRRNIFSIVTVNSVVAYKGRVNNPNFHKLEFNSGQKLGFYLKSKKFLQYALLCLTSSVPAKASEFFCF